MKVFPCPWQLVVSCRAINEGVPEQSRKNSYASQIVDAPNRLLLTPRTPAHKQGFMNVPNTAPSPGRHFLLYHLPVILYAGLIIAASSIPNLKTPQIRFIALDKPVHFIEYSLFAWIAFRSFSHMKGLRSLTLAYLLSVLFVSLFAMLDEYYQSFIPGRVMDVHDLAMDIGGAILVATFFWLRERRLKARLQTRSADLGQ